MKRNVKLYVKDILEYMERAERYIEAIDFEKFIEDSKTFDAVIRCIEVIGEAVKNIPNEIRSNYPSIPWRDIAGMRDKMIHGYFTVDPEAVWLVLKQDIPRLKPYIVKLLQDLENIK